ncbi:hypothetical protein HMI55_002700 [Coelomomyces lativittatus]|nr:hypothetical protein HMI55_002700 [Coelomomyces lativittatus]
MSESTANAIMRHYPTIHRLYLAYLSDANNAPHLLENIMVDREQSSRKIGSALSKRIHSIFMSNDPLYEPYS